MHRILLNKHFFRVVPVMQTKFDDGAVTFCSTQVVNSKSVLGKDAQPAFGSHNWTRVSGGVYKRTALIR